MLFKDDDGEINYIAVFNIYILPIIIVSGFYKLIMTQFTTEDNSMAEKTLKIETKNEKERQKIALRIQ